MTKTITLRLDNDMYSLFKKAAQGDRRTISNLIEFAAFKYVLDENTVDDSEMQEILRHNHALKHGLEDVHKGRYKIID